jgi:phosphoglucosamine mutase
MFEPLPQIVENVRYKNGSPLHDARVVDRIKACEARMNGAGRIVVRKSGTEPVIRVMAEGDDEKLVRSVVSELVAALREAIA